MSQVVHGLAQIHQFSMIMGEHDVRSSRDWFLQRFNGTQLYYSLMMVQRQKHLGPMGGEPIMFTFTQLPGLNPATKYGASS